MNKYTYRNITDTYTLIVELGPVYLSGNAPEQPFALVTVGRAGGGPQHKVVRRRAGDWVDQRLQRLLVHMHFLNMA